MVSNYYKVGQNRGKPRIWIQGLQLSTFGFKKGSRFNIKYNICSKEICYELAENGERLVSGKRSRATGVWTPLIDLSGSIILRIFEGANRVRADFSNGKIVISIHHQEIKKRSRERQFINNSRKGILRKGVLCSGGGISANAIASGLKLEGINTTLEFMVDRERSYLDVARLNNPIVSQSTKLFEASLEELEPKLLPDVDILSFSLPCTIHSPAGKAKNKNKKAEDAYDAVSVLGLIRAIDSIQPAILVSENVVQAKDSAIYALIKQMLFSMDYSIQEVILDQTNTHSLENRKRYWFIAISSGLPKVDLSTLPEFESLKSFEEIKEIVHDDDNAWKSIGPQLLRQSVNERNGRNFKLNIVNNDDTKIGVAGRGYGKFRMSEPMIIHDKDKDKIRLLTPTELAKAQSTDTKFVSGLGKTLAYEVLGQSIDTRQGVIWGMIIARDICKNVIMSSDKEIGNNKIMKEDRQLVANKPVERQHNLFNT